MRDTILQGLFSPETMLNLPNYYRTDASTHEIGFAKKKSTLRILQDTKFLPIYVAELITRTTGERAKANRLLERIVTPSKTDEFARSISSEENKKVQGIIREIIPEEKLTYLEVPYADEVKKAREQKKASAEMLSKLLSPELVQTLKNAYRIDTATGINYGFDESSIRSIYRTRDTILLAKLLTELIQHVKPRGDEDNEFAITILTSIGFIALEPEFRENCSWNGAAYLAH